MAIDRDGPRYGVGGADPRRTDRGLPQRDPEAGCRDARQLDPIPDGTQPWRRGPSHSRHSLDRQRALSQRAGLVRDRHLLDLQGRLPRDRMPRLQPEVERGDGRRSPGRPLEPPVARTEASRLELRALMRRTARAVAERVAFRTTTTAAAPENIDQVFHPKERA